MKYISAIFFHSSPPVIHGESFGEVMEKKLARFALASAPPGGRPVAGRDSRKENAMLKMEGSQEQWYVGGRLAATINRGGRGICLVPAAAICRAISEEGFVLAEVREDRTFVFSKEETDLFFGKTFPGFPPVSVSEQSDEEPQGLIVLDAEGYQALKRYWSVTGRAVAHGATRKPPVRVPYGWEFEVDSERVSFSSLKYDEKTDIFFGMECRIFCSNLGAEIVFFSEPGISRPV